MKSISNEVINKIKHKSDDYMVHGLPSGVLLLRILIREAHQDTNATITRIRNERAHLDEYRVKVKSNVEKFNLHVEELMSQLRSRGQDSDELLTNLFKSYKRCNDDVFVRYTEAKENNYDDGIDITPEHLMQVAINKYQIRVDNSSWEAPSESRAEIIALKAEVKKLQKRKTPPRNNPTSDKSGKSNDKKSGSKKPDWMLKEPTKKEKEKGNKKEVNNKLYHWCKYHKSWTRHKPSKCTLRTSSSTTQRQSQTPTTNPTTANLVQNETILEPPSETDVIYEDEE